MGCDIHLVLEKRYEGKWVGIDTFNGHHCATWSVKEEDHDWAFPAARDRNYKRFAALAGVRGEGPAPRGIPSDASDTTNYLVEDYGNDGHSHSWLPLADACKIWAATEHEITEFSAKFPESYFFGVNLPEGLGDAADDYRVVFWFDN